MSKTLILHIGMPKTGTSTIQNTLKENRTLLSNHGILYPLFEEYEKIYPHKQWYSTGNGNLLAYSMRKDQDQNDTSLNEFPSFEYTVKDIAKNINNSSCDIAIISHEDLLNIWPKQIHKMILVLKEKNINLRCIFYIREQVSFHISNYQQHIKQIKSTFTFDEYLEEKMEYVDFKIYIDKWTKYISNKDFIVKLLHKDIIKTSLARYFLQSVGYTNIINLIEIEDTNISLGMLATELLRSANINNLKPSEYEEIKKIANSDLIRKIDKKSTITVEQVKRIKNYYKTSNQYIGENFLSEEEKTILIN